MGKNIQYFVTKICIKEMSTFSDYYITSEISAKYSTVSLCPIFSIKSSIKYVGPAKRPYDIKFSTLYPMKQ